MTHGYISAQLIIFHIVVNHCIPFNWTDAGSRFWLLNFWIYLITAVFHFYSIVRRDRSASRRSRVQMVFGRLLRGPPGPAVLHKRGPLGHDSHRGLDLFHGHFRLLGRQGAGQLHVDDGEPNVSTNFAFVWSRISSTSWCCWRSSSRKSFWARWA